MTSIPISKLILVLGIWLVLGILSAFSLQSSSGLGDFENVANSTMQGQILRASEIDLTGVSNPVEATNAAFEVASTSAGWTAFVFKSLTLQAPMWDADWTSPIRAVLWLLMLAVGMYMLYEGIRLLQGFIP